MNNLPQLPGASVLTRPLALKVLKACVCGRVCVGMLSRVTLKASSPTDSHLR